MRGIERLEWLEEEVETPTRDNLNKIALPRHQTLSSGEVSIHVTRAMIEELQDALQIWNALRRRK